MGRSGIGINACASGAVQTSLSDLTWSSSTDSRLEPLVRRVQKRNLAKVITAKVGRPGHTSVTKDACSVKQGRIGQDRTGQQVVSLQLLQGRASPISAVLLKTKTGLVSQKAAFLRALYSTSCCNTTFPYPGRHSASLS